MSALDIIVLLLIGGMAITGFMRGFLQEILSLAALIAAIIVVRLFHAPVTSALGAKVGTDSGAAVIAFVLLFGITLTIGKLVARTVGDGSRKSALGPFDRVLGFGFGGIKGLLVATVCFLAFTLVYDTMFGTRAPRPDWAQDSRTFPLLNASGRAMSEWLDERRRGGTAPLPAQKTT